MNVTLKLPDDLITEARHLALDERKSLSALVADLLVERLGKSPRTATPPKSLGEAMKVSGTPDWFYEKQLPLPDRKADPEREFTFGPDEG